MVGGMRIGLDVLEDLSSILKQLAPAAVRCPLQVLGHPLQDLQRLPHAGEGLVLQMQLETHEELTFSL